MNILIVKASSLGDIIHAFTTLAFLRQRFPEAKIDWVVEKPFAALVAAHPFVNAIHVMSTKAWRKGRELPSLLSFRKALQSTCYDVVFDLQGNTKSALATFLARSKDKVGFGRNSVPEIPNLLATRSKFDPPPGKNIREDYLHLVRAFFNDQMPFEEPHVALKITQEEQQSIRQILQQGDATPGRSVLVCAGSAWANKQLTPESLLELLEGLNACEQCRYLFAWGNAAEKAAAEKLAAKLPGSCLIPKLSFPALQNLMDAVDLILSMDSLPLHLAGTTRTPTFSFFGPSAADKYRPIGAHHGSYQGACPYGQFFAKRCPVLRTCRTGACIKEAKGEELLGQVTAFLRARR